MGIENPVHILFIAAVALVVLGPKRLPELARAAGKSMREFREALNGGVVEEDPTGGQVVEHVAGPTGGQLVQQPAAPPAGQLVQQPAAPPAAQPAGSPADPMGGQMMQRPADPISGQVVQEEDPAHRVRSPDAPDRGPL